jgi:hypothetical protein
MIAQVLQELIQTHQTQLKKSQSKSLPRYRIYNEFYSENRLKMTIECYVDRLEEYLHISNSCFALALIYIDRLTEASPTITISE